MNEIFLKKRIMQTKNAYRKNKILENSFLHLITHTNNISHKAYLDSSINISF